MRRRLQNVLPCYWPGLLRARSASALRNRGRGFFPTRDDDRVAIVQWSKRRRGVDPLDRGEDSDSGDSLGAPGVLGSWSWSRSRYASLNQRRSFYGTVASDF